MHLRDCGGAGRVLNMNAAVLLKIMTSPFTIPNVCGHGTHARARRSDTLPIVAFKSRFTRCFLEESRAGDVLCVRLRGELPPHAPSLFVALCFPFFRIITGF